MDLPRLGVIVAAVVTATASVAAIAAAVTSDDSDDASNSTLVAACSNDATEAVAIEIRDFAFGPADAAVSPGTEVVWTNADSLAHSVVADDASFSSPDLDGGASFSCVLTTPGTYPYHCGIHDSMTGTITVAG